MQWSSSKAVCAIILPFFLFFCKFLKHSKFIGEHEFPDLGSVHCNNYNYIIFSKKSSGLWSHRCVLVSRTLSKVFNPSLRSQRDWVSADGATLHTQPVCTSPSCYWFPWHLERWHDMGVTEARRHHLHSCSITNIFTGCLGHICISFVRWFGGLISDMRTEL